MTDLKEQAKERAEAAKQEAKEFFDSVREAKGEEQEGVAEVRDASAKDLKSMQGGNPNASPTPVTPLPGESASPPLPGSAGGQADWLSSQNPPSSADQNAGADLKKAAEEAGHPVHARGVIKMEDQPGPVDPFDLTDEQLEAQEKAASGEATGAAATPEAKGAEPKGKVTVTKSSDG